MLGWKFNCDSAIVEQVYLCLQDILTVGLHSLANLLKFEVKDDMPVLLHNGCMLQRMHHETDFELTNFLFS